MISIEEHFYLPLAKRLMKAKSLCAIVRDTTNFYKNTGTIFNISNKLMVAMDYS
jgi:hypothetical protein